MQENISGSRRFNVEHNCDAATVYKIEKLVQCSYTKGAAAYLRWLKHYAGARFWGATVDEVAFVYGSFAQTHFRLAELAVADTVKQCGYGSFMMAILIEECLKRGIMRITFKAGIDNTNALRFYAHWNARALKYNKEYVEMEIKL